MESDGPNESPKRGEKHQKMRESKDSGRTVAEITKKNAKKFKTPLVDIPIENSKKSESEEERIDWGSGKSNQFSDELKSDNQQILEDAEDETIMSDSACSSDIQYCQTFSTTLLWVDHWTRIIFLIFQGFWLIPCRSINHKNVPCEILYISMKISKAQLQNILRNFLIILCSIALLI